MIRIFTFFILASFTSLLGYSQVELNASDMESSFGFEFARGGVGSVIPTSAGEGQTWDLSTLTSDVSLDSRIVDPQITGLQDLYPNSNFVLEINDGVSNEFYTLSESGFFVDGQYEAVALELIFQDPQLLLPFPASFGVTGADEFSGTYIAGQLSATVTGSLSLECDATGTLIMPWGTVENVVRSTAAVSQIEVLETPTGDVTVTTSGEVYAWFAAGFPGPIVVMRDFVATVGEGPPSPFQSTLFISDIVLSSDNLEIVSDLNLYPNPARDRFTVSYNSIKPEPLRLELYDISGRMVWSVPRASAGIVNANIEVPVGDLSDGIYILRLSSSEGSQEMKVVVGN